MLDEQKVRKLATLIRVAAVMVVLLVGFLIVFNTTKPPHVNTEAYIKTMVAPSGATIKLDGSGIKAETYTVDMGKHQLDFSKKGFVTQTKPVVLSSGQTLFVGAVLQPDSNETANWYADHPDDKTLAEGVTGAEVNNQDTNSAQSYPILSQLPFISDWYGYRIDSGVNKNQSFVSITATNATARQNAISWIYKSGYNPADIKILFKNTTNPFGGTS